MIDEGELRERFPEILWDQPVPVSVVGASIYRHACRYCIAMYGLVGTEVTKSAYVFHTREEALEHIGKIHHD